MKQKRERTSLEARVFRPLAAGMTAMCVLLTVLAALAAYPAAREAGWTGWLILGALAFFSAEETAGFFLLRAVSVKYLRPLSLAVEAAASAAAGDLTRSADEIPPTTRETDMLLQAVRDMERRSSGCLLELERVLEQLAAGDLTARIDCARVPECEGVCGAMEEAGEKLRGAIGAVRTSLEQLSGPLAHLEHDAAGLSQDEGEEQAWEALLRNLEHLTEQLRRRADSAAGVSRAADVLRQKLVRYDQQYCELSQSVGRISDCTAEAGKIVKDMETASFQCSVLARTAYVEAAGAGVNGKGFAIVSCELRVLASRIAQAAQEAAAFVEEMRRTVQEAAVLTDASARELQGVSASGTEVCRKAASAAQEAVQAKDLQEAVRQANRLDALSAETRSHAGRISQTVQVLKKRINKLREALRIFRLT